MKTQPEVHVYPAQQLMWGPTLDKKMTWDEAKTACADCRLGGFSDWRLATAEELLLLVDRSRSDPAIDTEMFPDTKSSWYWSSSPLASSPGAFAWSVGFSYGGASCYLHSGRAFVRPVRSASSPGQ